MTPRAPSPWSFTPGSWLLLRVTDRLHSAKKTVWWLTIRIEKMDTKVITCAVAVRRGSLADEPMAKFRKKFPAIPGAFLVWKGFQGNFRDPRDPLGVPGTCRINGSIRKCRVHTNRNRDGTVTKVRLVPVNGIPVPVSADLTGRDGGKIISLEIQKYGLGEMGFPGGNKKFAPQSHSPDAFPLMLNERGLQGYLDSTRDMMTRRGMKMEGIILDTAKKRIAEYEKVIDSLAKARAVFIGEIHDSPGCHAMQQRVIRDLYDRDPGIALAFEMFSRTGYIREGLDRFVSGDMDEKEFREKIYNPCWDPAWYGLYREIFLFARDKGIPMIGLNAPRELMKNFREGPGALTPEERGWFAREIDYGNERHRRITLWNFTAMEEMGITVDSFYPSQCIWDDTMAESAVDFFRENPGHRLIICAGALHTGYGVTVPHRMEMKGRREGIRLTSRILFPHQSDWFDSSAFEEFMRLRIADFIYYVPGKESLPGYSPAEDDRLPWMAGFRLFNEGKLDEAEKALEGDTTGMREKITGRITAFRRAQGLAMKGEYEKARMLIAGIPEIYAPARKIWLDKIRHAEMAGQWPE